MKISMDGRKLEKVFDGGKKENNVTVEFEKENTKFFSSLSSSDEKPVFELRILGMRYEQAVKALEKQLDLCCINNFKNFSIVHGKVGFCRTFQNIRLLKAIILQLQKMAEAEKPMSRCADIANPKSSR